MEVLTIEPILGTVVVGQHGPEYRVDSFPVAGYTAFLNCGCDLAFTVPPITGELLYCLTHDDYFKCHVPGGFVLKCNSCEYTLEGLGHDGTLTHRKAKVHAVGSRGQRNPKHQVMIGKLTKDSVEWKTYSPKQKDN